MKNLSLLKTGAYAMAIAGGLMLLVHADDAPAASADYAGKPYSGTPQAIPGTIKAITYDLGGQDVAFSYKGKPAQTKYRTSADSLGIAGFDARHLTTKGDP